MQHSLNFLIIMLMNKSQQMKFFSGRQKLTSDMKLRPEKSEVSLVEKLTRSFYWWVEQCVPTLCTSSPSLSALGSSESCPFSSGPSKFGSSIFDIDIEEVLNEFSIILID